MRVRSCTGIDRKHWEEGEESLRQAEGVGASGNSMTVLMGGAR